MSFTHSRCDAKESVLFEWNTTYVRIQHRIHKPETIHTVTFIWEGTHQDLENILPKIGTEKFLYKSFPNTRKRDYHEKIDEVENHIFPLKRSLITEWKRYRIRNP